MTVNVYTPTLPLVVSTDYKFIWFLLSQADTKIAKTNPTLTAGDFILFRKAAGTWLRVGNLTTLPALVAGDTEIIQFTVLAAELPAGTQGIAIKCKDAADAEWCDLLVVKDVEVAAAVGDATLANQTTLLATFASTSVSMVGVVSGSTHTWYRGHKAVATITLGVDITGYSKIYYCIKKNKTDADAASMLLVEKTAGVSYINGAAIASPVVAGDVTLTVTDEQPCGERLDGRHDTRLLGCESRLHRYHGCTV